MLGVALQKNFPKNFAKFTENCATVISNTVKGLQAVRPATLLKRDPCTVVSEPVVRRCPKNRCSSIFYKIYRKTCVLESLFKLILEAVFHRCSSK